MIDYSCFQITGQANVQRTSDFRRPVLSPPGGETYHRAMRFDFLFSASFVVSVNMNDASTAEITSEDESEPYDP
jgi:hypothetical protein